MKYMSEKNVQTSKKGDYKFWIIFILLLIICSLQFINLHKMNKMFCRKMSSNKIERMMNRDMDKKDFKEQCTQNPR